MLWREQPLPDMSPKCEEEPGVCIGVGCGSRGRESREGLEKLFFHPQAMQSGFLFAKPAQKQLNRHLENVGPEIQAKLGKNRDESAEIRNDHKNVSHFCNYVHTRCCEWIHRIWYKSSREASYINISSEYVSIFI